MLDRLFHHTGFGLYFLLQLAKLFSCHVVLNIGFHAIHIALRAAPQMTHGTRHFRQTFRPITTSATTMININSEELKLSIVARLHEQT